MPALYNENDPAAIAVLQHLIAQDVIAPGVVDGRSIKDLTGADLEGYEQVHRFAGGGLWSVAARLAGWPDHRPIWTCSCPCQPWSAAGQQKGVDDPRHLWPDVFRLLGETGDDRPEVIVGEQVSGSDGYYWLDGVCADLESEGYTVGAVDIPSCAVDAPHQRNRLYLWAVDDAERDRRTAWRDDHRQHDRQVAGATNQYNRGRTRQVAEPYGGTETRRSALGSEESSGEDQQRPHHQPRGSDGGGGISMGDGIGARLERLCWHGDGSRGRKEPDRPAAKADDRKRNGSYWSDAEWIICHDGKARRAKPGLRLLVDGFPGRVDLWRIGGNAIVPWLAAEVLAAVAETIEEEMRRAA